MSQTRNQRNAEKIDVLIEVLKQEGAIPEDWANAIDNINEHNQGQEMRKKARERRGPPDNANNE